MYKVLVIGDILMDNLYWLDKMPECGADEAINSFEALPGGSAANTACVLGKLGVDCYFIGHIGADATGDVLKKHLEDSGVKLDGITQTGSSGFTLTIVDKNGERTMMSYRDSCAKQLIIDNKIAQILKEAKVVLLSGYWLLKKEQADTLQSIAKIARQNGTVVMLDAAPIIGKVDMQTKKKIFKYVDVILPNQSELFDISEEQNIEKALEKTSETFPAVVAKLGKKGSILSARADFKLISGKEINKAITVVMPAEDTVNIVDTTGAGDAFNAGFISAYLASFEPDDWLKQANLMASKAIAAKGATSAF